MKKSTLLFTGLLLLVSFASFFYKELIIVTQCISFISLVIILIQMTELKYFQPIAIQDDYVLIPHRKRRLYYSSIEMIQFNEKEMVLDISTEGGDQYALEAIHCQDFLKLVQAALNANPAIYVEDSLPLDESSYQKLIESYQDQKKADGYHKKRHNLLYSAVLTLVLIVTTSISIFQ